MIGDRLDLSQPPDFGARRIVAIHVHHEGGGSELHEAADVERMALSRTDEHFARVPYHLIVCRPVGPEDALDAPTVESPWVVEEGRPLSMMPASIRGAQRGGGCRRAGGAVGPRAATRVGVDQAGRGVLLAPHGDGLSVSAIVGHRELEATLCPGIDPAALRARVEARLGVG